MLSFTSAHELQNLSLSYSFVSYFMDPTKVENFLKNDQAGAAHATYGADIGVLMKHLITSLVLCLFQLLLFCSLRRVFKKFYQPKIVLEDINASAKSQEGFFDWMFSLCRYNSQEYLDMGLDAFFFIRFIKFLLVFFGVCGFFNLIILVPVNLISSTDTFSASGLDKFSISNVSKSKVSSLNFHFVCSICTIVLFEFMLRREFLYIAKVRQRYMNSWRHRCKPSSRVLLLGNIPNELRSLCILKELFLQFPGGVEHVWLVDDYHKSEKHFMIANEAIQKLESFFLLLVKTKRKTRNFSIVDRIVEKQIYPPIILSIKLESLSNQGTFIKIPALMRMVIFQRRVKLMNWSMQALESSSIALEDRIAQLSTDDFTKMDKAFILFKKQEAAYMAHQSLLFPKHGWLDESLVDVDKDDIIWHNLLRRSGVPSTIIRHLINGVIILLTCLYVIPVSLISLVSQIPLLTQLLPFMGFLRQIPTEVGAVISSLLPTFILSLLTDLQLAAFGILLMMKGHWTGAEVELDLQMWYFMFMFIQQFLVVSVLTSLVVVFLSVVEKPVSIPLLLAENIPMSSIFFFKFLSVKAFALCGSNFLRIRSLIRWSFITNWVDRTYRQDINRTKQLTKVQWGAVYASFSVYASIGIIYSIIAPLASIFMIFLLIFFMLYYKNALKYIYSRDNPSETTGRLYSRALFQLYTGVYCLEFCMIGILLLLKNDQGEHLMKFQAFGMALVFGLSVSSNVVGYTRFRKLFEFIPQIRDSPADLEVGNQVEQEEINVKTKELMYLHPCYQYQKPVLWVPDDGTGTSVEIINLLSEYHNAIAGSIKGDCEPSGSALIRH